MYKCDKALAARVKTLRLNLLSQKNRVSGHVLTGEILTSLIDTFTPLEDLDSDNPPVGARLLSSMFSAYLFFASVSSIRVQGSRCSLIVQGDDVIQYLSSRGVSFYFEQAIASEPDADRTYFVYLSTSQLINMIYKMFDLNPTRYVLSTKGQTR